MTAEWLEIKPVNFMLPVQSPTYYQCCQVTK